MRLPLINPDDLTEEQKPLYEDMRSGIAAGFNAFCATAPDGSLMGPWNPWLHQPKVGVAVWELTKALSEDPILPPCAREIAILVTGTHFHAGYQLYAHVNVVKEQGLAEDQVASLVAGVKPSALSGEEAVAYDVAWALVHGSVLPQPVFEQAVKTFGDAGAQELIHLVGLYCLISMTLNGFNVPVPDEGQ